MTTGEKLDTVFAPAGTNKPVTREEFDLLTEKVKGKEIRHEVLLMVNRLNAIGDANSARLTALESHFNIHAQANRLMDIQFANHQEHTGDALDTITERLDKLEQDTVSEAESNLICLVRISTLESQVATLEEQAGLVTNVDYPLCHTTLRERVSKLEARTASEFHYAALPDCECHPDAYLCPDAVEVKDRRTQQWLKSLNIPDGRPVFIQFDFPESE